MRKFYLSALMLGALSLVGITSCKKSDHNNVSPNAITLDALKVSGNLITLNWSKLANDSLSQYMVMRVTDSTSTQTNRQFLVDKSKTTLTDTLPLAPYVQYYVYGVTPSHGVKSNIQTSVRTDLAFMKLTPMDAIFDRSSHKLYIYGSDGTMVLYDIASKTVSKQIKMDAIIGYCALGSYNGTAELYVPRNDGWLFIYNATTLDQVDQINIGGTLSSVTANNNQLFITTSNSSSTVFCYDRASKSKISSTYGYDIKRLRLAPGTNSEFFVATNYEEAMYLKFSNTGTYLSQQTKYLSYYTSSDNFEVFPDGSKIITGASGVVIDKDLNYVSSLPHGSVSFTSFDFDNTNNLIYAGCNTKTIQAYAMSNFLLNKTIVTQGIPKRVFYDNGTVLSVSTAGYDPYSYYNYTVYTVVEHL